MLVTAFGDNCTEMRDTATTNGACTAAPALTGNLVIRNSVLFGCGSCADSGGAAFEIAKDGDTANTGDNDPNVCNETNAAAAGKNCDTEKWYSLLPNMANANGVRPDHDLHQRRRQHGSVPGRRCDNTACTGAADAAHLLLGGGHRGPAAPCGIRVRSSPARFRRCSRAPASTRSSEHHLPRRREPGRGLHHHWCDGRPATG